eukprot:1195863-Prorocentrum_minimum.AAC.2
MSCVVMCRVVCCVVLCCVMLCCVVSCCAVSGCVVLWCGVLCCDVLCCNLMCCVVMCRAVVPQRGGATSASQTGLRPAHHEQGHLFRLHEPGAGAPLRNVEQCRTAPCTYSEFDLMGGRALRPSQVWHELSELLLFILPLVSAAKIQCAPLTTSRARLLTILISL